MGGRWLRRFRDTRDDEQLQSARSLTEAFLDMENRQSAVESAYQAAAAFDTQSALAGDFESVRNVCYEAAEGYLSATGAPAGWAASNPNSSERRTSVERAQQLLIAARRGLDGFYERHREALQAAAVRAVGVAAEADTAIAAAADARGLLLAAEDSLRGYPSVQRASDQLEAIGHELQLARERGDLRAVADCTSRLGSAVRSLTDALAVAPHREEQARRTVASVRTRLDALRHRADSVGPNISQLLREFHADSSADVLGNEQFSRSHLDRAEALITRAVAAHRDRRPEAALELAGISRAELAEAERLIDTVAERLAALRELRDDPTVREREVRFRVRDAQRLAVDRGADKEWGTVLDAQVERVDRAVAGLSLRNPDYWAYHLALEDVLQFVATIVVRIRQRTAS